MLALLLALSLVARGVDGSNTEGEAFLKANSQKEGVVVLPSGLQYKVLQSGPEGGRRWVCGGSSRERRCQSVGVGSIEVSVECSVAAEC